MATRLEKKLYNPGVRRPRVTRSLAIRLTLWYSGVLAAAAILCFGLAYFLFSSASHRRTDHYLQEQAAEARSALAEQGFDRLCQQIVHETRSTGTNDLFVRVLRLDGSAAASSDMSLWAGGSVEAHPMPALPPGGMSYESWSDLPLHPQTRVLYAELGQGLTIQIGLSMTNDRQLLMEMARWSVLFIALALMLAVLVGWLMARRALSGVQQVTDAAVGIAAGKLDLRVPTSGRDDEVDRLARTFNQMADRIRTLVEGIKQTNDSIAHELRSPITRMRGLAEMNLAAAAAESEHEGLAENTLEECDRLLTLINTMLDIAEVEAGVARLRMHPLDLSAIVRDACEIFEPVAEDAGVALQAGPIDPLMIRGDVPKLQRAVANLLDNAIKYTPSGGTVKAEVFARDGSANVAISDSGPGIPETDLPHIFQRFYRGEKSRTRKGYGLGLSLAMAIVRAHGGTIDVQNLPGGGCRFAIRLPLPAPGSANENAPEPLGPGASLTSTRTG